MGERRAWDRRPAETPKVYEAFRRFRDLGPLRQLAEVGGAASQTIEKWSARFDWRARATAWDDEIHMLEDARRLEAIRTMHENHQRAGRAVTQKALAALLKMEPADIPAGAAARLLELGTRLERETLLLSVEELQGQSPPVEDPVDDPWERIARELEGSR